MGTGRATADNERIVKADARGKKEEREREREQSKGKKRGKKNWYFCVRARQGVRFVLRL